MAGNFPAEHPLWRDINFCPEWVYQRIQEEAARAGRPGRQVAEEPVILPGADQPWTDEENAVVLYAQSDVGRADGMSYAHVAHALGRTVGAVKSRWFREVRAWRDRQPAELIESKIVEGRKLAVEKYGVAPTQKSQGSSRASALPTRQATEKHHTQRS